MLRVVRTTSFAAGLGIFGFAFLAATSGTTASAASTPAAPTTSLCAIDTVTGTAPDVLTPLRAVNPELAAAASSSPAQPQLAFTGVDVGAAAGAAATLIIGGVALVRASRMRQAPDADNTEG